MKGALEEDGKDNAMRTMDGRCDSISAFVVQLQRLLEEKGTFILVFDGIDHQIEAAPTLLPALARLGEIVSSAIQITMDGLSLPDTKLDRRPDCHRASASIAPSHWDPTYTLSTLQPGPSPCHSLRFSIAFTSQVIWKLAYCLGPGSMATK